MDRKNSYGEMGLKVEIDPKSGFCYGVIQAIKQAEDYLKENETLLSLGSIVHNKEEVERLESLGMEVIDHNELEILKNSTLLVRAHGEPPSTYKTALDNKIRVIDCTCPVVLNLQRKIKKGYESIKKDGGTLLIFGKKNHAEVNGLLGQIGGNAVVIESSADLNSVDFSKPTTIFSQTTKDVDEYENIIAQIKKLTLEQGGDLEKIKSHRTICHQVSSRHPNLKTFAKKHSVIIFVSGKESSNGKILFETCKSSNNRSYKIETCKDIDSAWFNKGDTVGVCGATSTPTWQLEEAAQCLERL
ncbi:MAG: 4-hydroxy-3-methylbut-2-enyl diphosphate reductase [Bacteroidales bacterium]|nr:4-hydroxy-3-methylbut-2-enyl diphosphate reductase [Bacteroidales bacterium]